jgi:hypothetical protein
MHRRALVTVVVAAISASCSASDPKSPTEDLDDPADTLEGSWVLQLYAVQSGTVGGCPQSVHVGLTLEDVGHTAFTGTATAPGTIVCAGPPTDTLFVPSASMTNGSVTPDSIKFAIGNGAFVGRPINGGWQGAATFTTNTVPQQFVHTSWSMLGSSHTQ